MWPFWPPYWLDSLKTGNVGSRFAACAACSGVIFFIDAMPART